MSDDLNTKSEEKTALLAEVEARMEAVNEALRSLMNLTLRRPIIGGPFGAGAFVLSSMPSVSNGLHCVTFMVALADPFFIVAMGSTKADALDMARMTIRNVGVRFVMSLAARYASKIEADAALARASMVDSRKSIAQEKKGPGVSRKRKRMFEQHGGKCFYCACELDLLGSWHIDHRLPRAMGGDNSSENLALACSTCNLSKGDKTDVEFMATIERLQRVRAA